MVMSMEMHSEQASTQMDTKDAPTCAARNEFTEVSDTATAQRLRDELEQLRHDYDTLHARMVNAESLIREHREENEELKRSRLALSEEIMDLTKALFEEANGMVAEEAKARASLEMARRKLEGELESTKEALRLEKQQLLELRDRIHAHRSPQAFGGEGVWRFSKDNFLALLSEHSHKYFPVLLPQLRFSSRPRYDTAAGPIWDRIAESIDAGGCLREFSRFVERLPEMDADALLSHSFLRRLCETEMVPCLNFDLKPRPYVKKLILALLKNTCCVEKIVVHPTPTEDGHGEQSVRSGGSSEASDLGVIADLQMLDIDLSLNCPTEGEETIGTGGSPLIMGERLRGIMNHFTMSVSSLPETLLNGHNLASAVSSSANGSPTSSPSSPPACKYCSLCGRSSDVPKYRFRLTDTDSWSVIDKVCRQRLVAVGHFFTFIRHLRGGLHANRPLLDLYYDLLHYLRLMFYARLDRSATIFFLQSDYEAYLDLIEVHLEAEGSQGFKAKIGHREKGGIDNQCGGQAISRAQDTTQVPPDISSENQVPLEESIEGEEHDRASATHDVEDSRL